MPGETDVVIVGGGLAGLAAARRLHRAGVPWRLLEAADRLGGRVATDEVDGYLLDRGFQVLNSAYPRLGGLVDLKALDLGWFTAGVLVRRGDRLERLVNPLREPAGAVGSVSAGIGSVLDRLRFAALAAGCATLPVGRLLTAPETTSEAALRRAGLSDAIIEELLRPFLSGVLLDRELATSSRVLAVLLRAFARGRIGLPARGMAALPRAIADPLPADLIELHTAVTEVAPGRVRTRDRDLACRAVVVAVDPPAATTLLPRLHRVRMHSYTTYYHSTDTPPLAEPILLLDGDRREMVANTVVPSNAAPTYAPAGRHLVATSVVGPQAPPEPLIRRELDRLYGRSTADWTHLTTVSVPAALPAAPPPQGRLRKPVALGDGLFVAGDHRDTPSIQGALASGWRTAGVVLAELRAAG
ncbi:MULTISPECIES: NAD(P)/FAD-dependent oxidoreductase [Micromonospora]|uniref:FAD-binding protein n=1 Tax=Micromonospora solifontis TaxID=2487138 RepID=A0ABX9WD22_9ACTN|nr:MULTISPECIES: NAD(P)/FAD-dependent oxidoreductase [Micromonospora]NES16579.1 FAD-dependent oxidoreductase [Micromonospora sp. PPF5-17B]NES38391.1 FAD-dependent oxidoreductase [Micromonospora solifontis]NES58358.1 FAD-dependent oxidoreductase [Micromonospora sp. PPF5-6]RNL95862.1 FAD-binding protein [Micromonospora solifontis]